MKEGVASGNRLLQRRVIAQISDCSLSVQAFKIFEIAGLPDEDSQFRAFIGQGTRNMRPKETSSTSDKRKHSALSIQHPAWNVNATAPRLSRKRQVPEGASDSSPPVPMAGRTGHDKDPCRCHGRISVLWVLPPVGSSG